MNHKPLAAQFHRDGFLVVKNVFTADQVATIEKEIASFIKDIAPTLETGDIFYEQDGRTVKSMFRLEKHRPFFADLMRDPRMYELAKTIFEGENVNPTYVTYFGKSAGAGSPAPIHQDNGFSFWEPPHALNCSIAIDPHTLDNGVMHCCLASHTLGVQPHKPSGVPGFSQTLANMIDEDKYPPVPCIMQPGDITLHHTDTVHFSAGNRSTRSRRMITTGYMTSRATRNTEQYEAIQTERKKLHGRLAPGTET